MQKRLYKSRKDKVIDGVCGGIAEYFEIDPVIIRLIWAVSIFAGGAGLIAYIIAMIVIPKRPLVESESAEYIPASEETTGNKSDKSRTFLAIGLIIVGAVLVLSTWAPFLWGTNFWKITLGVILIGGGAYAIYKSLNKE